jgi:hypothetical protein
VPENERLIVNIESATTKYLSPLRTAPLPLSKPAPASERDLSAPNLLHPLESSIFKSAEPGPEDPAELQLWKTRYQSQLGLLTTTPKGEVAEKEAFAKAYLEQLVQQLAGDEIQEKGLDVRVELFSGNIPQAALDDSNHRELEWESQNPGQEWPVRGWMGAAPGNTPIYRLTVTEGLLNSLETREEVAFVLATQLERLFQHHAQDPENAIAMTVKGQSWIDSRQQQIANDSAAIARMCKANINPMGGLQALNNLYAEFGPRYTGDDQKVALEAVARVQEHEGVRFSALQAQVELLRRKGEPATRSGLELLPKDRFPEATGDYQSRLQDQAAFKLALHKAADELSGSQTPDWMFSGGPSPVALLKALRPSTQDLEEALGELCDHLRQSGKTPQQQGDGFLRMALAFQGDLLSTSLGEATRDKLRDFLAGVAAAGWQPEALLSSLSRADGRSLHRGLATDVLANEAFQSLLAPLAAQPGPLQSLLRSAAENYLRRPESGEPDLHALPLFLQRNNLEPQSNFPLASVLNAGALDVLGRQSPEALAAQAHDCGLPVGLVLCNDLRRLEPATAEFALQLRDAMQPIQTAANAVREDNARLRLRLPLADSIKLSAYLQELFASEAGQPFSQAFQEQLPALLKDVVTSCNQQGELIYDSGRPRELEAGLERRLCQMAGSGDQEALTFLSRHWAHELRVPTFSGRREWTAEAARSLATQPLSESRPSPYGEQLRQGLLNAFQLGDAALPDTSDASLAALNARRKNGEFEPKPEHFANPEEYQKARSAYLERCDALKSLGRFIATADARQTLSRLAILGHQPELSLEVASKLSPEQWVSLLESTEKVVERSKLVREVATDVPVEGLGADAGNFLMDGFMAVEKQIKDLDRFWDLAQRTVKLSPVAVEARKETRANFAASLSQRLQALDTPQLQEWLAKDFVLEVLRPEQIAALMQKVLGPIDPKMPLESLSKAVQSLDSTYDLKERFPAVFASLRDTITEKAKLQPSTLNQVFADEQTQPADLVKRYQGPLAGLSGLVAVTRNQSAPEQLATIEYLMGRSDEMPEFLEKAAENQSLGPVAEALRHARQELIEADPAVRAMVANSFLAGPTGLMNTEEGKKTIMDFVLKGVNPKFLKLARPMVHAVLFSQGDAESLAMALVLSSKPRKEGDKALTEADILNRVFDSYGVPGVKMKQYLAFTSSFEHFRETFETAQDAANPLNYYETIRLIQHRFGDDWPRDMVVDRTLGSGSVNVAIRYFNEAKGKGEVVSLGREDIAEATAYDFARFHKFVDALTSTPEGVANFGFVRGLIGIIQESVQLEFDKEAAKSVQQLANQTYKHKFEDGWTVKSIDAFDAKHLGLFMEEARGKTARKLFSSNRPLYNEAMRHMADVEFDLLKGQDATNNLRPRPNFANPDFHDGQVLIDEKDKTVTILDFGQAVPISNEEREAGLDLLTVLARIDTSKQAVKRLNKRFFPAGAPGLTTEDLKAIWKGPDLQIDGHKSYKSKKMDGFIRLLAAISQKGGKVPLSTVHWVLALNRQVVLGEKLDQDIKLDLVGVVASHKLGLPLTAFNAVHDTTEAAFKWIAKVGHGIASWALEGLFGPEEGTAPIPVAS